MRLLCLAVASLALTAFGLAPQSAAKTGIDTKAYKALMQTLADSWNDGDARKAAGCFTENALYTEPPDKQTYRGREALFKFFGGTEGRKGNMTMAWHHLLFDKERQIGCGELRSSTAPSHTVS